MTSTRLRGTFAVTKALAAIEPGPESEDGPGTFSLILSTSDLDRDGEVVDPGAFDPLPEHIAMDIDHGMSVATTVGSGRPFYREDGKLQVDGTYASTELGQQTRTLVREGHVRTASVAMLPLKKTKDGDGVAHITKADLLNGAFTPVPSNKGATVLSAKSLTTVYDLISHDATALKAGKRNSASDQRDLQEIHDLSAGLGAVCGDGSSEEGKSLAKRAGEALAVLKTARDGRKQLKSIVGSVEALQDRVRDALEDAYGEWSTVLRGVLPDSNTVVFDTWGAGTLDDGSWSQSFTDDGAVVTLTGDPSPVDIHEVVVPDADADREGKSASDAAATKAAADDADAAAAVEEAALKALRALIP